jgi:hypothetical protein
MSMIKMKSFICFEMLEEGWNFIKLFFWCFQIKNKVVQVCTKFAH